MSWEVRSLIEIVDSEFSINEVIDSVRKPEAGAIVIFLGTVRAEPNLDGLELESYKDMAIEKLTELRSEMLNRFSVLEIAIRHRVGSMAIGDNIVAIAVSAAHREEAFSACRFGIDELKVRAPIWKKELGPGTWVEGEIPTGEDSEKLSGMVDISDKDIVHRVARAEGVIELSKRALDAIRAGQVKKGDVLEVAKIAAISGVKQTPTMIPLCHPIPITGVDLDFDISESGIKVTCEVKADYKTGVEMEALTGVNCALLTIWDMVKYLEKDEAGQYPSTKIHDIKVILKEKSKEE
jgi:cyclic pyranopterin phosphate synthase